MIFQEADGGKQSKAGRGQPMFTRSFSANKYTSQERRSLALYLLSSRPCPFVSRQLLWQIYALHEACGARANPDFPLLPEPASSLIFRSQILFRINKIYWAACLASFPQIKTCTYRRASLSTCGSEWNTILTDLYCDLPLFTFAGKLDVR